MTTTMNRKEMNNTELDMVNGGFGWDDIVNYGKKVGDKVVTVVKKEVDKVVDTVVEGAETVVDAVRQVSKPTTISPFPGNPIRM